MTSTNGCGSDAGYQAHARRGEDPCADCRHARAAYMAQWRKKNPDHVARHSATGAAHARALRALAKRHPEEFAQLYSAELWARGAYS